MTTPIDAYNLSTGTKWVLSMPIKSIDPSASVDNLSLNLTEIVMPELEILPASMKYRNRQFNIPTGVREENKLIRVSYLLSTNWHQYRFLYKWYEMCSNEYAGTGEVLDDLMMDMTITIITEYKNKIFDIVLQGCWLNKLGQLPLNYQTGINEIYHSFSFYYQILEFRNFEFDPE